MPTSSSHDATPHSSNHDRGIVKARVIVACRGPLMKTAIVAFDLALRDSLGRMAWLSLSELSGGRSSEGAPFYADANGRDIAGAREAVGACIETSAAGSACATATRQTRPACTTLCRAGRLHVGDAPGHGVEIDDVVAERIPATRNSYRSHVQGTARCGRAATWRRPE